MEESNIFVCPIITGGDVMGSIITISDKEFTTSNIDSVILLSKVLAKHIEP